MAAMSRVARTNARTPSRELRKHVAVVHSKADLGLLHRKVSNVLLFNAYPELPDTTRATHQISISQLARLSGFNSNDHAVLKDALRTLNEARIEFNVFDADGEEEVWGTVVMLSQAVVRDGICEYAYPPAIRSQLHNPAVYALIDLGIQERFSSQYALALYENCVRYRRIGTTGWKTLDQWRAVLGVPEGAHTAFKYLNRDVLQVAIREVNTHSDITLVMEREKQGRSIARLKFLVEEKAQMTLPLENASASTADGVLDPRSLVPDSDSLLDDRQRRLVSVFGLTAAQALDLCTRYPANLVDRNVQYVSAFVAKGGGVRNLAAYVIEAIRSDYAGDPREAEPPHAAGPSRQAARAERGRDEAQERQRSAEEKWERMSNESKRETERRVVDEFGRSALAKMYPGSVLAVARGNAGELPLVVQAHVRSLRDDIILDS